MREITIDTGNYILYAKTENNGAAEGLLVTAYKGMGSELYVPAYVCVDGRSVAVSGIGKKAFLGAGFVSAILPENVTYVGDWAFAQCARLKNVEFKAGDGKHKVHFGKGAFDDCSMLEAISMGTEANDAASKLMGAVPCGLRAEYLLSDDTYGDTQWFIKWDAALSAMLDEDDAEGYTDVVLCGEEDIQRSLPEFVADKKRKKCGLCLLRLLNDDFLKADYKLKYIDYLYKRRKGQASEESWEVILRDHGDNIEYYNKYAEIGCVTNDNIDAMLADMGERYAEAKAYLIRYRQTNLGVSDAFSAYYL